jgi:transcriptional regulator with AAA-type ATPase domain
VESDSHLVKSNGRQYHHHKKNSKIHKKNQQKFVKNPQKTLKKTSKNRKKSLLNPLNTRDEIKPVSNHSNNQPVWMVWKFALDKLLKEQFFNLLQKNISIKTIWSSIIFIWCAHKLNIRDFFLFKIFNTFNFFQFFKILIAWTGLISSLLNTLKFP